MSLNNLAPELVHHIYNSLSTISDVINLSITCRRLNCLLRHSQKLPTLFAAAEREFGPIEDIAQLVTFNTSQAVHIRREPQPSYALLRQMIKIGSVAKKFEEIYPSKRWQTDFLNRRSLTAHEGYFLRRAVYRYWLFCEAFQNRSCVRSQRLLPHVVEERAQLLRTWTTDELIELEDLRLILEEFISTDLCPTNGASQSYFNDSCDFYEVRYTQHQHRQTIPSNSWPPDRYSASILTSSLFNNHREDRLALERQQRNQDLPVPQRRKLEMAGWGDDIAQYYVVQSMMKLNPAQIMHLYEHASNQQQVEVYIGGLGEEWFWNNGQTFLDTWTLVLAKRGLDPRVIRDGILDGQFGIAASGKVVGEVVDEDCW